MSHIWPIVKKNFLLIKRSLLKFIFQVIYPSLFVIIYGLIIKMNKSKKDSEIETTFYDDYAKQYGYTDKVSTYYQNTALIGNKKHVDKLEALLISSKHKDSKYKHIILILYKYNIYFLFLFFS